MIGSFFLFPARAHIAVQRCVCDGVAALERATEMASQLYLFSHNEQLDELATSNLKLA